MWTLIIFLKDTNGPFREKAIFTESQFEVICSDLLLLLYVYVSFYICVKVNLAYCGFILTHVEFDSIHNC